jgi:hypothetical protein
MYAVTEVITTIIDYVELRRKIIHGRLYAFVICEEVETMVKIRSTASRDLILCETKPRRKNAVYRYDCQVLMMYTVAYGHSRCD